MLFNYLILISSRYQHRLSMSKRNLIYKDDGPNEKLGKYRKLWINLAGWQALSLGFDRSRDSILRQ